MHSSSLITQRIGSPGDSKGDSKSPSSGELKESKIIRVPEPTNKVALKMIYPSDIEDYLRQYDKLKGPLRTIKGDQEDIAKIRNFHEKLIIGNKYRSDMLNAEEMFELIELLEQTNPVEGSASATAIGNLKAKIGDRTMCISDWRRLSGLLKGLRYVNLLDSVNLERILRNLFSEAIANQLLLMQEERLVLSPDAINTICKSAHDFDEFFENLRSLRFIKCENLIPLILANPELGSCLLRIEYKLGYTKLDKKTNLEKLINKSKEYIINFTLFIETLEYNYKQCLRSATQQDFNNIEKYLDDFDSKDICSYILANQEKLTGTNTLSEFIQKLIAIKSAENEPEKRKGCLVS